MRRVHCGFTLIEMMVVLAVIAILALVAMPNAADRIARGQIVDALPLADIAKGPIASTWSAQHTLLPDNASAGLPEPDKVVNNYISSLSIENGVIQITFGNHASGLIRGKILSLRPAVIEDAPVVPVTWVCGYATPPHKMTVEGDNKTNIPRQYLPLKCRF